MAGGTYPWRVSSTQDLAAALAGAAASGGGEVVAATGTYDVSVPLVVEKNVRLALTPGALLQPTGDHPVVIIRQGGGITGGGFIDVSRQQRYSSAAVALYGHAGWGTADHHTVISDIRIRGDYQEQGSGLGFFARGPGASIAWVKVENVDVQRMYYGVRMEATNTEPAELAWINGNRINVDVAGAVVGFLLRGSGPAERVNGNWITSQIQTMSNTVRVLDTDGKWNVFRLMVWDWNDKRAGFPYAVDLRPNSSRNRVQAPSLGEGEVRDSGRANQILHRGGWTE